QRLAEIVLAPVGEEGMLVPFVGDQALVADDGPQLGGEIRHKPLRRPDRSAAEWRDLFWAEKKRGPSASLGATGASRKPQHLARVHDVFRIERALDGAHGVELDLAAIVL